MISVIYHNPDCGTSRNTLAMMRQSGEEPHVIEYLKTPPTRDQLVELLGNAGSKGARWLGQAVQREPTESCRVRALERHLSGDELVGHHPE